MWRLVSKVVGETISKRFIGKVDRVNLRKGRLTGLGRILHLLDFVLCAPGENSVNEGLLCRLKAAQ